MLKHAGTLCAAFIIAATAFTAPAQAQRHGFHAGRSGVSIAGPRAVGPRIAGPRMVGPRVAGPRIAGSRVYSGAWRGGWTGRYAHGYRYRHRGYWPYAGLAIGALAAWPYYGYYDGYYPYYDGGYVDEGYVEPGYGGDVAYSMQRFRSYNPATGTYRGYDGLNHACP